MNFRHGRHLLRFETKTAQGQVCMVETGIQTSHNMGCCRQCWFMTGSKFNKSAISGSPIMWAFRSPPTTAVMVLVLAVSRLSNQQRLWQRCREIHVCCPLSVAIIQFVVYSELTIFRCGTGTGQQTGPEPTIVHHRARFQG